MNLEDMRNLSIVGYLNSGNEKGAVDEGMGDILVELKSHFVMVREKVTKAQEISFMTKKELIHLFQQIN